MGSEFHAYQALVGELYQLNVLGRVLKGQVETMFQRGRCGNTDPSIIRDIVIS